MSLIQDALKKIQGRQSVRSPVGVIRTRGGGFGSRKRSRRLIGAAVAALVVLFGVVKLSPLLIPRRAIEAPVPSPPAAATVLRDTGAPITLPSREGPSGAPVARSVPPSPLPREAGDVVREAVSVPETEVLRPAVPEPEPPSAKAAAIAGKEPRTAAEPGATHQGEADALSAPSARPVVDGRDRYHFNMGLFYQRKGEYARAAEAYEKAVELNPFHVEAYNNLGVLYKEIGELDRAIVRYGKALAIDPTYVKAYNNLGVALVGQGKLEEATAQFERALELNPKNVESYTNLGVIYRRRNLIPDAHRAFQAALNIDPNHAESHYNLALVMEGQGRIPEAVEHYRRFLAYAEPRHRPVIARVISHIQRLTQGTGTASAPKQLLQP
jgi:type IV pilus biogenesis/stability protein PilW